MRRLVDDWRRDAARLEVGRYGWTDGKIDALRRCADELEAALLAAPAVPAEKHLSLQERIDALASALYVAGVRSSLDKDGLPRLVAEGIYAYLRKVQKLDLHRVQSATLSILQAPAVPSRHLVSEKHEPPAPDYFDGEWKPNG